MPLKLRNVKLNNAMYYLNRYVRVMDGVLQVGHEHEITCLVEPIVQSMVVNVR